MTQDPATMNRFERDAAKRGVKKSQREKSWGAELRDKALAPADQGRNRFGKPNLPAERKLEPATAQKPSLTINGRKYTDPKLLEAKAAMEHEKTEAAKVAQLHNRTLAMQQDSQSIKALFEGWMASRKQFYPSRFNMENMSRALGSMIEQSDRVMSVGLLDEVFEYLNAHNYLEKAVRHRGEPAPLEYPEYVPPVAANVAPVGTRIPAQAPADIALPEGSNAKTMPLDELARAVRKNYNYGKNA